MVSIMVWKQKKKSTPIGVDHGLVPARFRPQQPYLACLLLSTAMCCLLMPAGPQLDSVFLVFEYCPHDMVRWDPRQHVQPAYLTCWGCLAGWALSAVEEQRQEQLC
jgi:hypothetical protein